MPAQGPPPGPYFCPARGPVKPCVSHDLVHGLPQDSCQLPGKQDRLARDCSVYIVMGAFIQKWQFYANLMITKFVLATGLFKNEILDVVGQSTVLQQQRKTME